MELDTLKDGHQRKYRVHAKVLERPSVQPYVPLELSPLLILWMHAFFFFFFFFFFHDFYILY